MDPSPVARLNAALAGRYTLERELGRGGMATVWLARDLKHDRPVALKVLRPELAAILGAERFLAEIRTTANLQHPHILPLHDSGDADGLIFYVMPFVAGESLRDRLTREHQLPVDEAVRITREVADALDYAHRHHVIHRDIKPENILLHDGRALVADFGIALAVTSAGGTRMTETGMSLGTPHYMSPEQTMGERDITARTDVYALGCVLYEMLVGEPPFTGPTAQAIVARVVTEAPRPLQPQRHTVPPSVEAAVLKALEKLPADRFGSAAQLAGALVAPGVMLPVATSGVVADPRGDRWRRYFMAAAGVALLSAIIGAWGWLGAGHDARQATTWQYITLGDSVTLEPSDPSIALSPDGSTLVFRSGGPAGRLWTKRRDQLNPTPISGTERATHPVFSPDGEWIAFVVDRRLKKVRARGGEMIALADSVSPLLGRAAWLDDGTLVYVTANLREIRRVGAAGGPTALVLRDSTVTGGGIGPVIALPRARGVLLRRCSSFCAVLSVHVLDFRTGAERRLLDDAWHASYLPIGRLLYVRRDGVAMTAPFDLRRLEVTDAGTPVLEGVQIGDNGIPHLAWSASGSLVYAHGPGGVSDVVPVRVRRDGSSAPIDTSWYGEFYSLALSLDGRQLAVGARSGDGFSVWVKHLDRGPFTRLSFGARDRQPVWSPDGRLVAFIRDSADANAIYVRPADGSGGDRLVARLDRLIQEATWSPDGRWLVVRTDNAAAGAGDIVGVHLGSPGTSTPLVATTFTELNPDVSPDGRWLAYTSNESGVNEVYVRAFPNTEEGRWQVSNGGGSWPRWSPDGGDLFYLDGSNNLIAAQVRTAPGFAVAGQARLFDASDYVVDSYHQAFDVMPDGRSFVFMRLQPRASASNELRIVSVENWFTDLQARLNQ